MATIAEKLTDKVIATDDNPRTEDNQKIMADIVKGFSKPQQIIHNREEAIKTAIEQAKATDVILIAGKGHEDYQIIGTEKLHFRIRKRQGNICFNVTFFAQAKKSDSDKYKMLVINFIKKKINQ